MILSLFFVDWISLSGVVCFAKSVVNEKSRLHQPAPSH